MRTPDPLTLALALLLGTAGALAAQAPAKAPAGPPAEPKLVFEREVFIYPGDGRRDPFASLAAEADLGPRFEELVLEGIIHSASGARSMVLLSDGRKIYRARVGDVVGNSRVTRIGQARVEFAVEELGMVRQRVLELERKESEGASE
jgi:hypothetical protein